MHNNYFVLTNTVLNVGKLCLCYKLVNFEINQKEKMLTYNGLYIFMGQCRSLCTCSAWRNKSATGISAQQLNMRSLLYLYLYITWQYALLCYRATGVT